MYPRGYTSPTTEIRATAQFLAWLDGLRDVQAKGRVQFRIERLAAGNPGDFKGVGGGVLELRIPYGPGYRVYYIRRGPALIILLAGGDKHGQAADIALARRLAVNL
ncbi:MAG: type II toxin-antitoxin system RelE/ParE family toxin [Gemmatimonadetes bacterium]|nr:type II toxin-antitoxin system RelE/ParE family toxin [Gemmatimonadota bacterium]